MLYDPEIPVSGVNFKETDTTVKKCIYVNVHNHTVYNNEKYRNNLSLQHMLLIKFIC